MKPSAAKVSARGADGLIYKNVLACYHHLHAAAVEKWAPNFVKLANAFMIKSKFINEASSDEKI